MHFVFYTVNLTFYNIYIANDLQGFVIGHDHKIFMFLNLYESPIELAAYIAFLQKL